MDGALAVERVFWKGVIVKALVRSVPLLLVLALVVGATAVPAGAMAEGGPHDLHGPGDGFYRAVRDYEGPVPRYQGPVWFVYDHQGCPFTEPAPGDPWIVGLEGITRDGYEAPEVIEGTASWGEVHRERAFGDVVLLRGTFYDEPNAPLAGRTFTVVAYIETRDPAAWPDFGSWMMFGQGFFFRGTLEGVDIHESPPACVAP